MLQSARAGPGAGHARTRRAVGSGRWRKAGKDEVEPDSFYRQRLHAVRLPADGGVCCSRAGTGGTNLKDWCRYSDGRRLR